jgi:hypothetical protein
MQVNTFTYCFSLYFLNAVSQGFKIADQNDQNWLYFSYEIDTSWYYLDKKGFLGNYTLGKRAIIFFYYFRDRIEVTIDLKRRLYGPRKEIPLLKLVYFT